MSFNDKECKRLRIYEDGKMMMINNEWLKEEKRGMIIERMIDGGVVISKMGWYDMK